MAQAYNPTPSTALTASQLPYSSPDAFGAGIGEAGKSVSQGLSAWSVAFEQAQGMINDALVTNADNQWHQNAGEILGGYKALSGLAAASAAPKVQADLADMTNRMRSSLPNNMAKNAFDTTVKRNFGYALQDIGEHATTQIKAADIDSTNASIDTTINQGSNYSVAKDDNRFGGLLGNLTFQVTKVLQSKGFGPDAGTGMEIDPKTGSVSFDEKSEAGKQAKAVYDQSWGKLSGELWENRIRSLADDPTNGNVKSAYDVYAKNVDAIPPEAQAKIAAWLTPKVKQFESRSIADSVISNTDQSYVSSLSRGAVSTSSNTIYNAITNQESGGNPNAPTSVNGAIGSGQILPATFAQYAKPGENINNPTDNSNVSRRIVDDYTKKYNGDAARVAVAYFSGPGNVAPTGSPTPYITDKKDGNGKSVSSYVGDVLSRTSYANNSYVSKADYYRSHGADIIQQATEQAAQSHPDDPVFIDQVRAQTEAHLNDAVRQQDQQLYADRDLIWRGVNGTLTKGAPVTSIEQLESISPEVKAAWDRYQMVDPTGAHNLANNVIVANSKGAASDYGTQFYSMLQKALLPANDPNVLHDISKLPIGGGKDALISVPGAQVIQNIISSRATPQGDSDATQLSRFLNSMHSQLTFSSQKSGIYDAHGEQLYGKFLQAIMPNIIRARENGQGVSTLFNPQSKDYIGQYAQPFMRTQAQIMSDQLNRTQRGNPQLGTSQQVQKLSYNDAAKKVMALSDDNSRKQFLQNAVKSGQISLDDGKRIAVERGYARPDVPVVH